MRDNQPSLPPVRVLVADGRAIYSQLLGGALGKDRRIKVVATVANSSDVIRGIVEHHPDILVISTTLDEQPEGGLALLMQLRSHRDTKTVVLLDSSKSEIVVQAFRAGARGVFSRNEPIKTLCKCICVVHAGQVWANSEQLRFVLKDLCVASPRRSLDVGRLGLLSERERAVAYCISEGLTNRETAKQLKISEHTVKNYVFHIFNKLGVSTRVELLFCLLSGDQPGVTSSNTVREPNKPGTSSERGNGRQGPTPERRATTPPTVSENRNSRVA